MKDIYLVLSRCRRNWHPVSAFTECRTAKAFVAEKLGIPLKKVGPHLRGRYRTYRIRHIPLDETFVGWIVKSRSPDVDFSHYLEWHSRFDLASAAADMYPLGYVHDETLAEARDRLEAETN